MRSVRQVTNELIDLCEQGVLSWEMLALSCLRYMSEDDVRDMAESNELISVDDEDEDENNPQGF